MDMRKRPIKCLGFEGYEMLSYEKLSAYRDIIKKSIESQIMTTYENVKTTPTSLLIMHVGT